MSAVFNETHLNQPVHTDSLGDGKITEVSEDTNVKYGVVVHFKTGAVESYTLSGQRVTDSLPELKFGYASKEFDYGKPKFTYTPFEFVGNPIWCWVSNSEHGVLSKVRFRQVIACSSTPGKTYLAIVDGHNNTYCRVTSDWGYAIPLTEKELTIVNP